MTSPKKCENKKSEFMYVNLLDEPNGTTPSKLTAKLPAKLTPSNTPTRHLTNEEIKIKLQRAEERRQVF